MKYVNFQDKKLSRLGFGAMRFPTVASDGPVDFAKTEELIKYAYGKGVNYYDTAYIYHGGKSEETIGKILSQFPRDSWYLADKLPGNFINVVDGKFVIEIAFAGIKEVFGSLNEIFEKQLARCGVDYFDFYLLHNVTEDTFDLYTDEKLGFVDFVLEQKRNGRIKHVGFSAHARYDTLEKFVEKYDCFEFAQLQINYLDWSLQDSGKKYELLTKHGIPVVVMEPVRGGKLANPGTKPIEILKAARAGDSPAQWAFRFLQDLPNVSVVLSGMTTMEQVVENIEIFGKDDPMTDSDKAVLNNVVEAMADFVPCTACRYCCGDCPKALDIPLLINTYNEAVVEASWLVNAAIEGFSEDKKPSSCIACGACNPHCPQGIDIPDVMSKFAGWIAEQAEKKK